MATILLIEDEPRMANVIARGLREQSYAVDVAQDGNAGLYQSSVNDYDLVVLDVLLPQRDGFEVCREMRARGNTTPVLMLTARAGVEDRVRGFDSGADDYLAKPFNLDEFLMRIERLLKRSSWAAGGSLAAVTVTDTVAVDVPPCPSLIV